MDSPACALAAARKGHAQIPILMTHQTLLIIGFVWPEPNSSAAGGRMMQLIALFQQYQWHVVFASTASDSDYMANLESLNVSRKSIVLNDSGFDVYLSELNPTIVLFDRFMTEEQFGWRVASVCPNALRILDTEDLHCLRQSRQKALKSAKDFSISDLFAEEIAKREIASILRSDISLMISEFEMALLQEHFKVDSALLFYLPLLCDSIASEDLAKMPSFEDRVDFVFIGNFHHNPNKDAVVYLKEKIWPIIHSQLPTASLHIYGAYPTAGILQMNSPKTNFYVNGRAADAKEVISKSKVLLAPLRFGAGIKGKLLEAMQYGTPSITTSIGAEAMYGNLPWNGSISDDPQQIANEAVQLYQDVNLWKKAQQNGLEIINNRFLKSLFETDFINHILSIQENLKSHRANNFFGAMLLHHTMRSTEYLSRWIEAKNKP